MDKQTRGDPAMRKLADLIDAASIAMLTTEEADGSLRSPPLATLQLDSEGHLWFFTAMSSGKVGEIDQHRKVNLSYANVDKQDYVSVSGHTRLLVAFGAADGALGVLFAGVDGETLSTSACDRLSRRHWSMASGATPGCAWI